MQYSNSKQGICPTGWHLPTYNEIMNLKTAVGENGNSLKKIGQGHGSGAGTNTTGFSALLPGYRRFDGFFSDFGVYAFFWCYSEYYDYSTHSNKMGLYDNDILISLDPGNIIYGYNIRCLKD